MSLQTAIAAHPDWWYAMGIANGLGLYAHEYTTPESVWSETYDADFDGEGYVGSCVCPHCQNVANHYNGAHYVGDIEYECGNCGHNSGGCK